MASFCVFEPPEGRPGPPEFVRDGFSVVATALGPIWLVWRGAWLSAALWSGAVGGVLGAGLWNGASGPALTAAVAAICVLTGLEAASIRSRALLKRGYALVSVIERPTLAQAETVHFARTLPYRSRQIGDHPARAPAKAEQIGVFIEGSR